MEKIPHVAVPLFVINEILFQGAKLNHKYAETLDFTKIKQAIKMLELYTNSFKE